MTRLEKPAAVLAAVDALDDHALGVVVQARQRPLARSQLDPHQRLALAAAPGHRLVRADRGLRECLAISADAELALLCGGGCIVACCRGGTTPKVWLYCVVRVVSERYIYEG